MSDPHEKSISTDRAPAPASHLAADAASRPRRWAESRGAADWFRILDELQANVMVADMDLNLVFANKRAMQTFRVLEKEIQSVFRISADEILGASIHRFHRNPARNEAILRDPGAFPRTAVFSFGGVTLETRIQRVSHPGEPTFCYVVSWEDVSERMRLEKDLHQAMAREQEKGQALRDSVNSMLIAVNAAKGGDLTTEIPVHGSDEIGKMADGLREFLQSLREHNRITAKNAAELGTSARKLTDVSLQMSANAEETSTQATVVASSSKTVSESVQTVATAVGEMTKSITEISLNATKAADMGKGAVHLTESTNAIIAKLGRSTQEIGAVVKLITSIAAQTNLLALNATIEAARAGEAGRGFAVVANEVKELAKETAGATEDIGAKIAAIRSDMEEAIKAIASISDMIRRINDMQGIIATAVEEQSATSSEMSRSIAKAALGSQSISSNLEGVATAARNTSSGASELQTVAQRLSDMAQELEELVGRYKWELAPERPTAASLQQIVGELRGAEAVSKADLISIVSRLAELLGREAGK
ncbi:MAG: methyl-accepting chemotaxis protein [Polyangia bacterium]